MATREQLEKALRSADAAGDASAARQLAAAIKNLQPNGKTAPSYADTVKQQFDALPMMQKPVQAASDILRIGANGLTFGGTDKLSEALGNTGARQATQDASIRAGTAGDVAGLGASVLPMMTLPELAGPASAAVGGGLSGLLAKLGIGATEGSAAGVLDAYGHDTDPNEGMASGALSGMLGQGAASALAKGVNTATGAFKKTKRLTPDDLSTMKDKAYDDMATTGVEITPTAIQRMLNGIGSVTQTANPIRHPSVVAGRKTLQNMVGNGGTNVPLGGPNGLDVARQVLNRDVVRSTDAAESGLGLDMQHSMDDFTRGLDAGDVTARSGSPEEGVEHLMRARDLNTRMRKLEEIDNRATQAERRAAKSLKTGEDTTIKNNVESLLNNRKKLRGFTPDETAQMEEIVRGTKTQNVARQLGRLAPGGGLSFGGMGAGAAVGAALGAGPAGIALGAVPLATGYLAKKVSEKSTKRSMNELMDLVASGGNAAALRRVPTVDERSRNALARLLLMKGLDDKRR